MIISRSDGCRLGIQNLYLTQTYPFVEFRVGEVGAFWVGQLLRTWSYQPAGFHHRSPREGLLRMPWAFIQREEGGCHPYRKWHAAGEESKLTYAACGDMHGGRRRYPDRSSMLSGRVTPCVDPQTRLYPIVRRVLRWRSSLHQSGPRDQNCQTMPIGRRP